MQSKRHTFGPLLIEYQIDKTDVLNKMNEIAKKSKEHETGWLSKVVYYEHHDMRWFERELEDVFEDYKVKFFDHCNTHKKSEEFMIPKNIYHHYRANLDMLWINYMKSGDYNPPHAHRDCDISFVVYTDVPKELIEENSKNPVCGPGSVSYSIGTNFPTHFCPIFDFFPKENSMFIFPSQLLHYVMPFKSDVIRTSIAGSIKLEKLFE
tara:strand:- start:880 stop:1503 length:624 start_codon:yes stop_codon:yes gene_type:complete